jgi:hypothetical protein
LPPGLTLNVNQFNRFDVVKMEVASLEFASKEITTPQLQRLLRPKPDWIKLPSQNLLTFHQTRLDILVEDLNEKFFRQWIPIINLTKILKTTFTHIYFLWSKKNCRHKLSVQKSGVNTVEAV